MQTHGGCRLRGKHPREQGLKLDAEQAQRDRFRLRGKHPREQGLKRVTVSSDGQNKGLRGKHPREQGLKRKSNRRTREQDTNFEENIQENKD